MSHTAAKIAISLPGDIFKEIEHIRHQLGLARSQAIVEAIRFWIQKRQEQSLEQSYVRGYLSKPEKRSEVEPFFLAGLSAFTKEEW
ncbi:MAG: hypothetical protein HY593_03315 [Candidatus Omnitrophica bacterium]|nr:hypothetical protein [Candidatus Omnitrophota bacterium]